MKKEERLVHFSLFGQDFSFYTDASEQEVEQVLELVRCELSAEESSKSILPSNKMLIFSCLRLAARCLHAETQLDQYQKEQKQVLDALIERVSAKLNQV